MKPLTLDSDEKILFLSHQHWAIFFWRIVLVVFLIVMPFFLMFPLFAWGRLGIALFVYSIAVGVLVLLRTYVVWHLTTLVITNKRVFKTAQSGFFDTQVSEMMLSRINDVSHRIKGFWGTLMRYGTLRTVGSNRDVAFEFTAMRDPERARKILATLLHAPASAGNA